MSDPRTSEFSLLARRKFLRYACGAIISATTSASFTAADEPRTNAPNRSTTDPKIKKLPEYSQVELAVAQYFGTVKEYKSGDLISHRDVQAIFKTLEMLGWKVAEDRQILTLVLPDNHFLVQQLRSKNGTKFMQQSSSFGMIYDRLDRISDRPGGKDLISSLFKLPNASQFAKKKTTQGDPDLVALLPKDSSGFDQKIKDYEKPTGKIYTQVDLMRRLQDSYLRAKLKQQARP